MGHPELDHLHDMAGQVQLQLCVQPEEHFPLPRLIGRRLAQCLTAVGQQRPAVLRVNRDRPDGPIRNPPGQGIQ